MSVEQLGERYIIVQILETRPPVESAQKDVHRALKSGGCVGKAKR